MIIDYDYLTSEYAKCFRDTSRIYMITNFLKTYDATQKKDVQFMLFPRQQDICRTLGSANNVVTTKPRQAGITTTAAAFISCEMVLADKESPQTVLAIGNTIDLAQQMLFKIRDFLLQFPLWMWGDEFINLGYDPMEPPINKNVIFKVCNYKELVLKNGCRVVARSSGPDASRGVGGVTWLIFDESAFIENGVDVYSSALPTVSTGGHIIMISTPNGKDQLYYETCRRAKLKGTEDWNNFELLELKWYQDPRYNKFLEWYRKNPDTNEFDVFKEKYLDKSGSITYDQEHWEEMVRDGWSPRSPWYIKMCKQFNNDEQKIAQELDVSFLGSASNVVEPEAIEMQQKLNNREPLKKGEDGDPLMLDGTWIWKKPIDGHRYICSCDPSRGDSSDRTAIEILDLDAVDENGVPTIEQVLEYHGKRTGDEVGEIIIVYGRWYGNAYAVVECIGGMGDATVLMLMRLGYPNLYYDDAELNKYTMSREKSSIKAVDDKLPGFHSNAVRFQMLTYFANMVKTNQIKIRSKRVVQEMETWIYKGDQGRIDHMDGCHDDTLTCLAMAVFVVQYSMNKVMQNKAKDLAIVKALARSSRLSSEDRFEKKKNTEITASPKLGKSYAMPFYSSSTVKKENSPYGAYLWVIK